jgi:outer membrane lipoprotein SlyB
MRLLAMAAALLAAATLVPQGSAEAKGCIKGAVVGGVAGHYVGHHGILGATAGCLIGRHEAKKHAREQTQGSGSHR